MRLHLPAAVILLATLAHAEKWKLEYFYDQDQSSLAIADLKFPSPRRGIAIGMIQREKENTGKPVAMVTSDGGANWSQIPLKEPGLSLFFLNDSLGWMVTPKGLWQTEESGRSWRRVKGPAALLKVYFADAQHGWAVGTRKQIYETRDGGQHWDRVTPAAEVQGSPDYTHFGWIDFANKDVGIIAGWNRAPRRGARLPSWLDPEEAVSHRQWPSVGILLDTRDGGKSWRPQTSSLFGRISKVRLSPEGWGVGLIEYEDSFEVPSEVILIVWKTGQSRNSYKAKDRKVTDLAVAAPGGPIYLGAVEVLGKLNQAAVPGKVKILKTTNAVNWTEMDVDYRATARRVILAGDDPKNMWAATDTGMILRLVP
ncbi:MAG: hypothetical protein HYR60_07555 [Acidobacteria bacterium]|nr:hypothetical protein [Acidobacteriota bacterium]